MVRQEPKPKGSTKRKSARLTLSKGQKDYLARSRKRNHDKADQQEDLCSQIISHPLVCANQAELISDQKSLDELLGKLRESGCFAFDTEFIGEQSYYPQLCLVQVATNELVAVIDPLADIDITGFWELVSDPKICKIVHAGGQDLEPSLRHTGKAPANVYDTQISTGFAAMPYPLNLRELVYKMTGAKLHKSSGFTQWDRRPLSVTQLSYAADDVRYLPAVMDALEKILVENGNQKWAKMQNELACRAENWQFNPDTAALKIRGAKDLSKLQLASLASLLLWRETLAQNSDIPARMTLGDDSIRKLARKCKNITSTDDLAKLGSVPNRVIEAAGQDILKALASARKADTDKFSRPRPSSESAMRRYLIDSMWILLQTYCSGRRVHPALFTSRQELAEFFAIKCPKNDTEIDIKLLVESPLSENWRGELLSDLMDQLSDNGHLEINWTNGIGLL